MKKSIKLAFAAIFAVAALTLPASASASDNDPIVFVHGFTANAAGWDTMKSRFVADGYDSSDFATVSYGFFESNTSIANKVKNAVNSILQSSGKTKADVITHSMGGLSGRYYVKNLGGGAVVDDFVSIAGPNHGTALAPACFFLTIQCREMTPGSSFLNALNSGDETPGPVRYLTQTSLCDAIVVPAAITTPLDGAQNDVFACKEHITMHRDAEVYAGIRDFLD